MVDNCRYSLLNEPLFSVHTQENEKLNLSLPEILERLTSDEVTSFDALQPHQRQAWYSFLVQLATIALARNGEARLVTSASRWRELLLHLTKGKEQPWCLVVDDISQPAFMQSPVPEGTLEKAKYKADITTPDDLDMLVTSKNHDVKMHRITRPKIEHWIYALVTLQTMEGFLGQGNYGIARMNGGFGNRPLVEMSAGLSWGLRFGRDVELLLSARDYLAEQYSYNSRGIGLVWLASWNGSKEHILSLEQCDPFFIEICRRIRFTDAKGNPCCWRANTKSVRIAAPEGMNGVIGDPWTPVDKKNAKALTVNERGFSYQKLHELLFTGDYERPLTMKTTAAERDGAFVIATTLVRGQGKTDGWHNRIVPVPSKAIHLFGSSSERNELSMRAQEQVDTASDVQKFVLYPALRALLTADGDEKVESTKITRWTNAYNADVDDVFFPYLWESLDLPRDEARLRWQKQMFYFAGKQLEDAIGSTPLPSIRRYRAISAAESIFYGSIRKHSDKFILNQQKKEEYDNVTSL